MKIISIIGSPHGIKGSTARLLEEVLKGARHQGAKNETVVLKGGSVLPCRACDRCHIKGRCVQKDDFEKIKQKICDADGLILASPNYISSVSAQLKAFMDRCCGVIHRMGFEGKYGASVVTSGGGDEKPITDYMNHFLIITGIRPAGAVWATMGELPGEQFTDEIREKAFLLGENLVNAWRDKKKDKAVERKMNAFKARMRRLMAWRKDEWPYEYEYWKAYRDLK